MAKKIRQLTKIFKAYDIRGIYPEELDEKAAYLVGKAFVSFLKCKDVIVGRDMRLSSPALALAFAEGVKEMGADVVDIGEVCTDATYFASGCLKKPAVMFTASHNPPHYNGLKFSKAGAVPINEDTGLKQMKTIIGKNMFKPVKKGKGNIVEKNILDDYVKHVYSFVNTKKLKKMKVAVDAGNGMAGKIVPLVYRRLPVEIVPLFFELDGRFPNHLADPSKPENLAWLQDAVKKKKCDFGMAFDGDADRIFFVDEKGDNVHSSLITALISKVMLEKHPKSATVYNLVCSHVVPETIEKYGGRAIMERVGHSFIKDTMRKKNAIFGGEHSAHYYYKENYYADSGIITSVILCEVLSKERKPLSMLLDEFRTYAMQPETSITVLDKGGTIKKIKQHYSKQEPKKIMEMDGLTVEFEDWWFNVRPSNTEPLLRVNMEARTEKLLALKRKELMLLLK
jgi:phosphomannomutase